jgi:hypothetical protein
MSVIHQRVPHTTCAKCRQRFKTGDRVIGVNIVMNPNVRDPQTQIMSMQCSGDLEFVHASCIDTQLDGKGILTT